MSSTERRLQLRQLLESARREWTVLELSQRFGVSKPSAQRDLEALSRAGVPLEAREDGQTLRWFVRETTGSAPRSGLEVAAIEAAGQALEPFRGTDLFHGIERLRGTGVCLPVVAARFPRSARRLQPAIVNAVTEAITQSRVLELEYEDRADRRQLLLLEPAAFEEVAGLVYLRGRARFGRSRVWRTLVAWRILTAEVLDEGFTPVKRRRHRSFGAFDGKTEDVVVRFDSVIAPFIEERVWHPSQQLTPRADGSLLWSAKVSGMYEVVGWVMSWGARAELVSPVEWREEARQRISGMAERYAGAPAA